MTYPKFRFTFLTGDLNWLEYGGKWVSPKLNNGDFDYWLVLELTNMDEACGSDNEGKPKYNVQLSAVSPQAAGDEAVAKAMRDWDWDQRQVTDLMKVEALDSFGIQAVLKQWSGDNAHKLLREAKREAQVVEGLFGFYMDKAENRIGSTGWELIKGDIHSATARVIAGGSTEGRIIAKMHGLDPDNLPAELKPNQENE